MSLLSRPFASLASSQSKPILVIGCGIAGPTLAMLLKHKGFNPVLYEREPEIRMAGLGLGVSPQSFKVLNILGLADKVSSSGAVMEEIQTYSHVLSKPLGHNNAPTKIKAMTGFPMCSISRIKYQQLLYDSAKERGIPVHMGKKLVDVEQLDGSVIAKFADGSQAEGEMLVGCDGLRSTVRNVLFGEEQSTYMGIVQIGGYAPIPPNAPAKNTIYQAFGDGSHFTSAPISSTEMMWVNTLPEPTESREDWRRVSKESATAMLSTLAAAEWEGGPKEMIASTTLVTKYGLYERPISKKWHKGRAVLLGDAAHPTSPHIGQGANQAMEDCYHLVLQLTKTSQPFTEEGLDAAFTAYEEIRLPIVQESVGQAKKQGVVKVASGEAARMRDEGLLNSGGQNSEAMKTRMKMLSGPFEGESEL